MRYSGATYLSDGTVSGEEPSTSTHWHVIAVDGVYSAVAGSGIDISGNTISVADDLAAVIDAKEVKSNKKTTLTGNESSDNFYPTTKAVVDYVAANYENLSNKLTSEAGIDEDSTDTEYPTAKAVFDLGVQIVDGVNEDITETNSNLSDLAEEVGDLKSALEADETGKAIVFIDLRAYSAKLNNGTPITPTINSVTSEAIEMTATAAWQGVVYKIPVMRNTDYTLEFYVAGSGNSYNDITNENQTAVVTEFSTAIGEINKKSFNSGSNDVVCLRIGTGNNASSVLTFSDVNICRNDIPVINALINTLESDEYFETNKSMLAGNTAEVNDATNFTKNWAQAKTTTLVQSKPIKNALKLKQVKYNVGSTSLFQSHYIGLCTISGTTATITHITQKAGSLTGVVTVETNFVLDPTKKYYFFLICNSGAVQWEMDSTGSEYYTFPNPSNPVVGTTATVTTNSGANVNIGEFDVVYKTSGNFITELPDDSKKGIIVVAKEGGDYSTIGEAIQNANDSASNPVTIILCPGEYKEHITLLDRYISIVGVNRDACIIRDNSGKYNNDPIKISGGKWLLENLSLISTHTKAGGWIPSWVFPDMPSYALHIDNGSAGGYGVVRNCYLYCENSNALGVGTHNGETIRIENCQIVRNTTDSNYVNSSYKGAVACHSPNIYDDSETKSQFNMYNNEVTCNLAEALQLRHLAITAKMKCVMVGNTLVANGGITNVVAFVGGHTSKSDYIEIQSHGNSTNELNAT